MRAWTKSACVVLAWSILPITVVAAGMQGPACPAQANIRTTSNTQVTLTSTLSVAAAPVTAASPTMKYVVQHRDTLSGIAARFAVLGGWPALYAANRQAIGPDPNLIHPGTVLVLPGQITPARYTVAAGDTLSGIAARFAVLGGWPALYAANRQAIGPDPNAIHPGTVVTLPRPAAPSPPTPGPAHRRQHPPAPSSSAPAIGQHHLPPRTKRTPAATGMPQWLKVMLLAVGLFILMALLVEPVLGIRPRRQQAAAQAVRRRQQAEAQAVRRRQQAAAQAVRRRQHVTVQVVQLGEAGFGQGPGSRWPGAQDIQKAHIILADHDRLVVTRSKRDDMVCVLRPPGENPKAILRVARLVLPEERYRELAARLGMPPGGPEE
jgi:LysM repeat protein